MSVALVTTPGRGQPMTLRRCRMLVIMPALRSTKVGFLS